MRFASRGWDVGDLRGCHLEPSRFSVMLRLVLGTALGV